MSTRPLALYLSGLLGLTFMLVSLISVVPDAEAERNVTQGICAVAAVLSAAVGLSCTWLSAEHWVNRSHLLRNLMVVLAIGLTLFLLVGVIG